MDGAGAAPPNNDVDGAGGAPNPPVAGVDDPKSPPAVGAGVVDPNRPPDGAGADCIELTQKIIEISNDVNQSYSINEFW